VLRSTVGVAINDGMAFSASAMSERGSPLLGRPSSCQRHERAAATEILARRVRLGDQNIDTQRIFLLYRHYWMLCWIIAHCG